MNQRATHPIGRMPFLALALAMALFLGCSKPEEPENKNGTPGHGEHSRTEPGIKAPEKHGGHTGGLAEPLFLVQTEPAAIKAGEPVQLRFTIHDATGAPIRDFDIVHEKKLHLIVVREGLDHFAHIHPEIDAAGNITGAFTFPGAGRYRLYADYKPAGKDQTTTIAEVVVAGTPLPRPELVPDAPGRVRTDGLTADIAVGKAKARRATRIAFTLSDTAGKPVTDLQPYLGAMGHLVILSADGRQYVHAHPLAGKSVRGAVAFEAHFPQPGIYKGWGQFQRAGIVHDVPFAVAIE